MTFPIEISRVVGCPEPRENPLRSTTNPGMEAADDTARIPSAPKISLRDVP
jgi:hypothetical protein